MTLGSSSNNSVQVLKHENVNYPRKYGSIMARESWTGAEGVPRKSRAQPAKLELGSKEGPTVKINTV